MKQAKYRVETFIIPLCNGPAVPRVGTKDAKRLDESQETECKFVCLQDATSSEDEALQNLKNLIRDERDNDERQVTECTWNRYDRCSVPIRTKTLIPIDEKSEESDERFADLCYHGCRNGCSATVPTPQEVSEEVFRENWLQKLEAVKQRESTLKAKELVLQKRERELFKRERDVRIVERVLKEKIKRAELFSEETKNLQTLLNANGMQESSLPSKSDPNVHQLRDDKCLGKMLITSKSCDADIFKNGLSFQDSKKDRTSPNRLQKSPDITSTSPKGFRSDEIGTSTSTSSSETASQEDKTTRRLSTLRSSGSSNLCQLTASKSAAVNGKRRKPCKVYYEDLDTTLSADIGDSSFVQTSEKFNPALFRRPFSFARSQSERRPRRSESKDAGKTDLLRFRKDEQDRVLKKVTENISASQKQGTKFQHYGLIDLNVNATERENRLKEEKKYSYLDLETGGETSLRKGGKVTKERPVSWNEGTDEWLRKKRQAYNTIARKTAVQDFEDKENSEKCNRKINKPEKLTKKKDIRNKIFTVFW